MTWFCRWWLARRENATIQEQARRIAVLEQLVSDYQHVIQLKNDEADCLRRQRDTTLDTLDRFQWRQRAEAAALISEAKKFGNVG